MASTPVRFTTLVIGMALAAAPMGQALAKPGGGASAGHGSAASAAAGDNGNGHDNGHESAVSVAAATQGSISSQLGKLNAAHASKSAFAHANPNSEVGKIAAYAQANAISPNSAATMAALAAAANKTVTVAVRNALNALIGDK